MLHTVRTHLMYCGVKSSSCVQLRRVNAQVKAWRDGVGDEWSIVSGFEIAAICCFR